VVDQITGGLPPVTQQQQEVINSVQPKKGGSTVGAIVDTTTMDYAGLYDSLQTKLQEYFKAYYDSINKTTTDYSYGATLISLKNKNYTEGELSPFTDQKTDTILYGKSNEFQEFIDKLVKEVEKDIDQGDSPIIKFVSDRAGGITGKQKRELQEKLKTQVSKGQTDIGNTILNNNTNIVKVETDLNFIFRQLDVVASKLDGSLLDSGEPVLYDLSGSTFFDPTENSGSIFDIYTTKMPKIIKDFNELLINKDFNEDFYKKSNSTLDNGNGCNFVEGTNEGYLVNCPINRYYSLMCPYFTNSEKYQNMVNELISGPEVIADTKGLTDQIKEACNDLKDEYESFQKFWTDQLKGIEGDQRYKDATTWKIPDNAIKTCSYITPAEGDINQKTKRIKDLYSNINLNDKTKTFNGKVTFN
jgi:hypothetical protein